jgi:hypothetical protein
MSEASHKRHQTMVTQAKLHAVRAGIAYLQAHPTGSRHAYEEAGRTHADVLYPKHRQLRQIYLDTWKKTPNLSCAGQQFFPEERNAQRYFLWVLQARLHQERQGG